MSENQSKTLTSGGKLANAPLNNDAGKTEGQTVWQIRLRANDLKFLAKSLEDGGFHGLEGDNYFKLVERMVRLKTAVLSAKKVE